MLDKSPPHRVKGTAVFLTSDPDTAPAALLHNLKHNKVLHEKNVILTVRTVDTPRVTDDERVRIEHIGDSFWRVEMTYGYMETPNVPRGLAILRKPGLQVRHHGDIVLPVAALDPPGRAIRACRSGRTRSSSPRQDRERRHRLLPDPDRAGGRGRHAGDSLKAARPVLLFVIPTRHPCPSSLPVIPTRHPCPSSLPAIPTRHPCPSSLPCIPTRHPCPSSLPAIPTRHPCPSSLPAIPARHPRGSARGSTPFPEPCQEVDGRAKPGHDGGAASLRQGPRLHPHTSGVFPFCTG